MKEVVRKYQEVNESGDTDSWIGTKIRKLGKQGRVVGDMNGFFRKLTVKFSDGSEEVIRLNNVGSDSNYVHQYEWYCKQNKEWYRF